MENFKQLLDVILSKMSAPELAKRLNVDPSTVRRWRQGSRTPSSTALTLLRQLAEELQRPKTPEPTSQKIKVTYHIEADLVKRVKILAIKLDKRFSTLIKEAILDLLKKYGEG